jgi:YYY domain-containing protein
MTESEAARGEERQDLRSTPVTFEPAVAQPAPRSAESVGSRIVAWWAANGAATVVLAGILVFALALRVQDVNWDHGQHLHPDERFLMMVTQDLEGPSSVGQYFNSHESPLNPYRERGSFVYGTLPLFLNKGVASWLTPDAEGNMHFGAERVHWGLRTFFGADTRAEGGGYIFDAGYNSQLVGRVLSALFDVATVLLVFELGRVLWNRRVGLLAAGLLAATALHIQYSHFFGSEAFLTFFVVATIYFSVRIWKYGGWPNYALAGIAYGLAIATKLNSIPVLMVPGLAVIMRMWPEIGSLWVWGFGKAPPWQRDRAPTDDRIGWSGLLLPAAGGIMILVLAGVTFRIAQPYAFESTGFFDVFAWNLVLREHVFSVGALTSLEFLKPMHYFSFSQEYRNDIGGLLNQQSGTDFPPNMQWIERTPILFPLSNMVVWGLGLPLALAVGGGMALAAVRIVRKRDFTPFLPLIWTVVLFLFIARGFNPTMRYFLPIYPTMALLAAFGLIALWNYAGTDAARDLFSRRLSGARGYVTPALRAVAVLAVVGTVLWALAFTGIYRQDISRVQASHWIADNVEHGSVLTSNEWDDGLPLSIPGVSPGNYEHIRLKPYVIDSSEKVHEFVDGLARADYVIESSNRVYDSVTRVPARYPAMTAYYEHMFAETLGFEIVAEFTNYPRLLGIEIPDQRAEEAFHVYDHPKVTIWKKTDDFSRERALEVLNPAKADTAIQVPPGEAAQNALLFRPEVQERQREGGTWSEIFDPGSVFNRYPFLSWLLAMQVAALALVPLAIVAFRALPDRGYLLTKPLGVLGLAYLAYVPAAFFGVAYTRGLIAAALLAMVLAGVALAYAWRTELLAFVRERWRMIAFCESLFVLAFSGAYWVRLQNPDLWHPVQGGEKPMDFAYLNGVIRTTDMTQGPIDPWYSGGYLNYYYYGQFISATWTKMLGIVPEVAYNLIVPMFFALAAAATFSLAYNLAEATRRMLRRRPGGGPPLGVRGPYLAGLGAVFLVLLSGNLRALDYLHQSFARISPWDSGIPVVGWLVTFAGGFKEIAFGDASLKAVSHGYDWWNPSRALGVQEPTDVPPITEFPFWTFLFADLHAHLMSIPFAMTAVAIGLALVLNFSRLNPVTLTSARQRELTSWGLVVVLALIVGSLRWINSWDYPPFLLMGVAAIFVAERAKEGRFSPRMLLMGALKSAVMGVLTFAFFLPFVSNYDMYYTGFSQSTQTSALRDYFSHFGVMLILMAGFVLVMLARALARTNGFRALFYGRERRRTAFDMLPVVLALVLAGGAIVWAGTMQRWGVTALAFVSLVALAIVAYRELRNPSPTAPVLLFVIAMAGLGFGLSGGVELITLDGDIGRMNTVFKFYLHVWMLWGVVAAFGLWYVFGVMRPQEAFFRRSGELRGGAVRVARYAFAAAAVAVLVIALVYPAFGTRARIHDRFDPSLGATNDGLAYMEGTVYRNAEPGSGEGGDHDLTHTRDAINWVRQHIEGTPAIIEGVAPRYRSMSSRISIHTGLPAVATWEWHQLQQRPRFGHTVTQRHQDVDAFYGSTDVGFARDVIQKYDVEWVIVGDVERNHYPADGIAKFEDGLGGMLELAYENPSFWIFHVIPADELRTLATAESGR